LKKIREKDSYLSYIAYAELNLIQNQNYPIENLLNDLITKYPIKIEAYLRYWQLLVTGRSLNYKKAFKISEYILKMHNLNLFENDFYK